MFKQLLRTVIANDSIDMIHAHGTGTISNDQTELNAIESALQVDHPTYIYSHKGALGHSLGASGLVSVVLNCHSPQNRRHPAEHHNDHTDNFLTEDLRGNKQLANSTIVWCRQLASAVPWLRSA